jgi:epimerase transport system membrane fusion protein
VNDALNNQNKLPALRAGRPPVAVEEPALDVETGIEAPRRVGLFMVALVFGVFGIWAAAAPIEGAAHAPGTVTVRSYKKVVQHLEGGMIGDIQVQNGDYVQEGQPMLLLDDTQSRAQLEITNAQFLAYSALEARLIAERDGLADVHYPAHLLQAGATAQAEMEAQTQVFQARRTAREGGIAVLEQRIEQLRSRLNGLAAMHASKEELAASFAEELRDTRILLEQGFSDRLRLREQERNHSVLRGEAAELVSTIASTEMQIGETQLQILQTDNEFRAEVVSQLSETQTRLKDVRERMIALSHVLERTTVRAPVAGIVAGMQFHTVGGVIPPGSPIAEVVPQSDELVIEARISVGDIDRVTPGQEATIRFSSFSSSVPTIFGTVLSVSADAMADQNTGMPYYLARVQVTPEGMQELGNLTLIPGMPAEVFINSGARTFVQYVMKPFSDALARSLIED